MTKELPEIFRKFKKTFFVGGYVRDSLLQKNPTDIDLLVLTSSPASAAAKLPFKSVALHKEACLYRFILSGKKYIDIHFIRPENLILNLKNRDFTVNTLLMDKKGKVYDHMNALRHLKQKELLPASSESIRRDPVRILRAYRFSGEFKISEILKRDIKKYKGFIKHSPSERLKDELVKIFSLKQSVVIVKKILKAGVLTELFPPLLNIKKLKQNSYHHLDVLSHSLEVLRNIENFQKNLPPLLAKAVLEKDIELKLAALLHDTGKFETRSEKAGKVHFYKHENISAELAKECLKNLKFSNSQIKFTVFLIGEHMKFKDILNFSLYKQKRLIAKYGSALAPLLYFCACDRAAARGPLVSEEEIKKFYDAAAALAEKSLHPREKEIKPLINGNDIIKLFNIKPSKEVGRLKKKAYDFQTKKNIKDKRLLLKELKKCRYFLPKN